MNPPLDYLLEAKLDSRGKIYFNEFGIDFDEYEELIRKRLDEHQSILIQKSNIKDVCALLDMKSSKYFYEFTQLFSRRSFCSNSW